MKHTPSSDRPLTKGVKEMESLYMYIVHCQKEGCLGLYNNQEIFRGPRDIPRDIWRGRGKPRVQRGCTTEYIPTQGGVHWTAIPSY